MFSLTVCDHIMIAHSFQGAEFGPAQKLHGATFAVEAEFRAPKLDHLQLLVDIGLAKVELRRVLDGLDYSNLDDNPTFKGINTTTEHVAFHIHGLLAAACRDVSSAPACAVGVRASSRITAATIAAIDAGAGALIRAPSVASLDARS